MGEYILTKGRLEAFTDGVVAIVITILVLDIKLPETPTPSALYDMRHIFMAYTVSFIFISVIWVTHHRVFQMADKINYKVVWTNIFWLFWLTLCPAVTNWVGMFPNEFYPELLYALIYTMWSFSFGLICREISRVNGSNSRVAKVLNNDKRSMLSMIINFLLIGGVFVYPPIAMIGRFLVSGIWIVSYENVNKYLTRKK